MDLMIDLETMGTQPSAPVVSIGAVFFSHKGLGEEFYISLDIEEQLDFVGRRVTADTIRWWMEQSNASKKVFKQDAVATVDGLTKFVDFVGKEKEIEAWGNGPSFDITILEHILHQYGLPTPWKFWKIYDLRTFKRFIYNGKDMPMTGTFHNALDDAKHQAKIIIKGMEKTK